MSHVPPSLNKYIDEPGSDPDSEYGDGNLLCRLYRQTHKQLYISRIIENKQMDVYLKDPRSGVKQTNKCRSSEVSNLRRGLSTPNMTVKNFTKGLRVLRPTHITFTLTLHFRNHPSEKFVVEYDDAKLFSRFSNKDIPDNKNFLCLFWDQIWERFGFTDEIWKKVSMETISTSLKRYDSKQSHGSEFSNLRRGLGCPNMTIENFTKGILVINPTRAVLRMDLKNQRDRCTTHLATLSGNRLEKSIHERGLLNG